MRHLKVVKSHSPTMTQLFERFEKAAAAIVTYNNTPLPKSERAAVQVETIVLLRICDEFENAVLAIAKKRSQSMNELAIKLEIFFEQHARYFSGQIGVGDARGHYCGDSAMAEFAKSCARDAKRLHASEVISPLRRVA